MTAAPPTATTGRPARGGRRRTTIVAAAVAVAVVVVLVWLARPVGSGVPLDPRSTSPTGTAALVRLVERVAGDVTVTAEVPEQATTIVVLADHLDQRQRDRIRARVTAGARLVLFDPSSPLNPVEVTGRVLVGALGVRGRSPACDLLAGVADRVESAAWAVLEPTDDATATCYPLDGGAGLVVTPLGQGEVVVTGAVDALVNRAIAEADHAELAVALLAPTGRGDVTIVWDATVGGDVALLDLLPAGLVRAGWVLAVAAAAFLLLRARRLGTVVAERLPVRVPASELVLAIGDLLGRHGHRDAAAARLRADLRDEVAVALHVPRDTPADVLVELLAASGADLDDAVARTALLDAPVADDDALVDVTAALARVRARLRRTSAADPAHGR